MNIQEYRKNYYRLNKEKLLLKQKIYNENNKDEISKRKSNRYNKDEKHKISVKQNTKLYYENNKDKMINWQKKYYVNNIEDRTEYNKKYYVNNKNIIRNKNIEKGVISAETKTIAEKLIENWLIENNIEYIYDFSFKDCLSAKNETLNFDFYLSKLNLIIEYDGILHHKPIFGEDKFEQIKTNDTIKNKYCAVNKIKLIRISYEQIDILGIWRIFYDHI